MSEYTFIGIFIVKSTKFGSQMGISRSVAIIIAYLMSYRNLSFEDARLLVRNYRQNINPNHGFVQQLHVWNAIKDDWENRESSPEYRHWRTAFRAKVVTSTFPLKLD